MYQPASSFRSILATACCCLLLAVSAFAQTDSIIVTHTKWEVIKVAPGIKLKHYWFDSTLFGSCQNVSILEVKLNRKNRIDLGVEPKKLKGTSTIAQEHEAIAAINGTFFNMREGGSEDYIRSNGQAVNETQIGKSGKRGVHQRSAIVIDHNKVKIVKMDSASGWETSLKGEDIMVTGPLLVEDGKARLTDIKNGFMGRNPRSAIGVRGKKVYLVVVDGRNTKAAGMSMNELSRFMKWLHMDDAINLDGGGSSTLWVSKFPYGGVVNHPSDNREWMHSDAYKPGMDLDNLPADTNKWDHTGERPVANIILITRGK